MTDLARPIAALLGIALLLLIGGCSPLGVLNATVGSNYHPTANQPYGSDPRQTLDIYVPTVAKPNADVVIFLYGGRWQSGSKDDYPFVADGLAQKGFVTVVPNYRLFPQVDWRDFILDAATAYYWVETHIAAYGGNPQRIFIMGHSAGAHLAAMVALDSSLRKKAGSNQAPCGLIGLAGPYDFLPFTDDDVKEVFKSADPLIETQPVFYVDRHALPMLLLTGATDTSVNPNNSDRLAAAVRAAGGQAELIKYPDVSHVSLVLSLARLFRFLAPTLQDTTRFIRETVCMRTG